MQESSLAKIPQADVKLELGYPPTREEIEKTTTQLKVSSHLALIAFQLAYQYGGDVVLDKPNDLFTNCWEKWTLPEDLRNAAAVSLYKNKGEKFRLFKLYRGITLLAIAGKLLARVLLNRFTNDSTGKQARKPVWVQVQQRGDKHDLRAEGDSGEMQRTKHGSTCSFRRLDQGL